MPRRSNTCALRCFKLPLCAAGRRPGPFKASALILSGQTVGPTPPDGRRSVRRPDPDPATPRLRRRGSDPAATTRNADLAWAACARPGSGRAAVLNRNRAAGHRPRFCPAPAGQRSGRRTAAWAGQARQPRRCCGAGAAAPQPSRTAAWRARSSHERRCDAETRAPCRRGGWLRIVAAATWRAESQ
jgi:hypothetical protein